MREREQKHKGEAKNTLVRENTEEDFYWIGEKKKQQPQACINKVVLCEFSMEQLESSQEQMTNLNNLCLKVNEKSCISVYLEAGFNDGNPSAPDSLNSSEGNEFLKYDAPITNTQEPPLQGQTNADNGGSDELIDVRVCDICGDVGREALLALCSRCSDGAEHIYCMRIKMNKVPEGDWVCEDCMTIQEPKRQKQTQVEGLDSDSKKLLYLKEVNRGLPTMNPRVKQVGEMRTNHSGKRCGSDIQVGPTPKRRTLQKSVQPLKSSSGSGGNTLLTRTSSLKIMDNRSLKPSLKNGTIQRSAQPLKSYGSGRKTLLTRVSSLKIMDKGKDAVRKLSSLDYQSAKEEVKQACFSPGHRSPKPQYHFHGGDEKLCKSKLTNNSDSIIEVRQSREDVNLERKTSKGTSDCQLTVKRPEKKLSKSVSFSDVRLVSSNMSRSHFSRTSSVKNIKYSGGTNSIDKYDSVENRSTLPDLPVFGSGAIKVNTLRTPSDSEIVKTPRSLRNNVHDMKVIKVDENPNVEASTTLVARSVGENLLPSHSSYGIRSPPKNVDCYPERKANQSNTLNFESGCSSEANKVPSVDLHPMKELLSPLVPSRTSFVPESECVWKGAFELENGGKLPKSCSGIQAHLSSCASSNILEIVHKFHLKMSLKEVTRLDTLPIQFQRSHPTEQDIAVYFFAEDLQSYLRSYKVLLDGMMENDLALEANIDGAQFLILPSSLLPARSQRWNSLFFLWGVFRGRKVDKGSFQNLSLNVAPLKQGLCASVTPGTQNKPFSAPEGGSFSASHTSHNSEQGLESVDPIALKSSASTKTMDQCGDHEVSSTENCLSPRGTLFCEADMLPVADDLTEKKSFSGGVLCSDDFQKGDGYINQARRSDPASTCHRKKRLDVASWSSISVDSGPSGSSDGGACAKSDDGQVEQLQNPGLSLDLCLGSGLEHRKGQMDLDLNLVLGISGTSNYQNEQCPKKNSDDGNMSLALSLGMPCSNG